MTRVLEHNSEKNAFEVLYNFQLQGSLSLCSELN